MAKNWKAIFAFLSLLLTNFVANAAAASGNPADWTWLQWTALAVTTVGGTLAVYSKSNQLDIGQVAKAVEAKHVTLDQLRMVFDRFLPVRTPQTPTTANLGTFIPVNPSR